VAMRRCCISAHCCSACACSSARRLPVRVRVHPRLTHARLSCVRAASLGAAVTSAGSAFGLSVLTVRFVYASVRTAGGAQGLARRGRCTTLQRVALMCRMCCRRRFVRHVEARTDGCAPHVKRAHASGACAPACASRPSAAPWLGVGVLRAANGPCALSCRH
jgi:hypothetical protein